jgi:hypothetical protein
LFKFCNNSSRANSSLTNTCLALLPSNGPTIPAASNWSIILPARLYPNLNFLWMSEVQPD